MGRGRQQRWARLGVFFALSSPLLGCQEGRTLLPGGPTAPSSFETRPVDKAFLTRALRALENELPPDANFLEIRIRSTSVELQLIVDQAVTSLRYRETPPPAGAQIALPLGTVDPQVQVPVYGNGKLEENGFSAKEVDLPGIFNAFPVAIKSIDPNDGWVREVVVRRYFPFGKAVRARIYVESPRMAGSIDTNGNGIPLRKGRL